MERGIYLTLTEGQRNGDYSKNDTQPTGSAVDVKECERSEEDIQRKEISAEDLLIFGVLTSYDDANQINVYMSSFVHQPPVLLVLCCRHLYISELPCSLVPRLPLEVGLANAASEDGGLGGIFRKE